MKKIFVLAFAAVMAFGFASCNQTKKADATADSTVTDSTATLDSSVVAGKWTMPDPIDSTKTMGIEIKADGTAASINMATLPYSSWKAIDATSIEIKGVSKGNGGDTEVTDTAIIDTEAAPMTMAIKGTDVKYTKE